MKIKKANIKQKVTKRPDGLYDLVINITGKQDHVEDAATALMVKGTKMGLDDKMTLEVSRPQQTPIKK